MSLALGCGQPPAPSCDARTCGTWCDLHVSRYSLDLGDRLESPQLSSAEMGMLQERLMAVRQGAHLSTEDDFHLCTGGVACETAIPKEGARLKAGAHQAQATVQVPADGVWTLRYERVCEADETCPVLPEVNFETTLTPSPEGEAKLPVLERFEVFDGACAQRCESKLHLDGVERSRTYRMSWSMPDGRAIP